MKLDISKKKEKEITNHIQVFFEEERSEEIGIIAAQKVLDFFMEDLGEDIYNKALDDSRKWFSKRMEDIDIDYDLLYK
jgi:uncharacterized protein (DUF2164 family)